VIDPWTVDQVPDSDVCVIHESCSGREDDCRDTSGCTPGTGRGLVEADVDPIGDLDPHMRALAYRVYGVPPGQDDETLLGEIAGSSTAEAMTAFRSSLAATLKAEAEDEAGEDVDIADLEIPTITRAEEITDEDRARIAAVLASCELMRGAIDDARAAGLSPWTGQPIDTSGDAGDYLDSKP
jgi:hypothetical protein